MINRKKVIISIGVALIIIVITLLLLEKPVVHQVNPDTKPQLQISSDRLLDRLQIAVVDPVKNAEIQTEQVVEVSGFVKEVNVLNDRITVLLRGVKQTPPYIICDMQPKQRALVYQLQRGDSVVLKGIYKGFLKDAVLLDCIITYGAHD